MSWTRSAIESFLRSHLEAGNALDLDGIAKAYNDPFMFVGPDGVSIVPVQPFLSALPARRAFFDSLGQRGTELVSFQETVLDDHYVIVKADLKMVFQKGENESVEALVGSTFLLFDDGMAPRIVFHLESEDVTQAMRDRGILPSEP